MPHVIFCLFLLLIRYETRHFGFMGVELCTNSRFMEYQTMCYKIMIEKKTNASLVSLHSNSSGRETIKRSQTCKMVASSCYHCESQREALVEISEGNLV